MIKSKSEYYGLVWFGHGFFQEWNFQSTSPNIDLLWNAHCDNSQAKFHKMGRYDQFCCKPSYNELCGKNITSNAGVTPVLSLIANVPTSVFYVLT